MQCIHFVADSLNGCFIEPALVVWLLPWLINTWSIDPLARWFCIIDALNLIHWLVDSDSFASIHWLLVVASLSHWCVVSLMHWNIEPCFVGSIDSIIDSVFRGLDSLTHWCVDSDSLIVPSHSSCHDSSVHGFGLIDSLLHHRSANGHRATGPPGHRATKPPGLTNG